MGRGDRKTVRWAHDRTRKSKEKEVRRGQERGEQRKASK